MAKKKSVKKKAGGYSCLDDVRKKLPALYEAAAALRPFDDVISSRWVADDHIGIGIKVHESGCVWPSGSYDTYGARIYKDKVILFNDTRYVDEDGDNPGPAREEYITTESRLWDLLRQIPRPMHSFGEWRPLKGGQ